MSSNEAHQGRPSRMAMLEDESRFQQESTPARRRIKTAGGRTQRRQGKLPRLFPDCCGRRPVAVNALHGHPFETSHHGRAWPVVPGMTGEIDHLPSVFCLVIRESLNKLVTIIFLPYSNIRAYCII